MPISSFVVVGRNRKEVKELGYKNSGLIGKQIVGTGEDMHLTIPIYFDFSKPHVVLICGKRGTGKSYAAGIILEEFLLLEENFRKKLSFIVFDPIGIYWSMKFPNKEQENLLKEWKLEAKGFEDKIQVFVPSGLKEEYKKAKIPIDKEIKISLNQFSPEDWIFSFNLKRFSKEAINFERIYNSLLLKEIPFDLNDLKNEILKDKEIDEISRKFLLSLIETAKSWGVFSKEGISIKEIATPGKISVIDFSRIKKSPWIVRNLIASWISKNVYLERVLFRKEEEIAKIEGKKLESYFPLTWLVLEEAHNFCPSEGYTLSLDPILTIAKQGREPGIGLITITQMPNKIHSEILSQTDIIISFRLTNKQDIQALNSIMQIYVKKTLEQSFNELPKEPGAALILDDNLEKIFKVKIRPRISWHAGGTATLI